MTDIIRTEATERRIGKLPVSKAGYPVPFFVEWIDGEPDFRVMRRDALIACVRHGLCWVCGEPLGRNLSFVSGPMCGVNRVSAEPPSHTGCAMYSAEHCPFLVNPKKRRREGKLPDALESPGGIMLTRNPGVAMVWTQHRPVEAFGDGTGGVLFRLGDPVEVMFYAQGRPATRAEIEHSVETGYPALMEMAEAEGPVAVKELERMRVEFEELLRSSV